MSCHVVSCKSFLFGDLHPLGVFLDPRDKVLLDLIALAAGYAEYEIVEGSAAKDVDMIAYIHTS